MFAADNGTKRNIFNTQKVSNIIYREIYFGNLTLFLPLILNLLFLKVTLILLFLFYFIYTFI